ncbi:MAG: hypothetical protein UR61_C0047G0003 [candidate division WS6 bacterium GW2011_GWE1_34_7]|uniref:Uncharacterized protein n=1 Tax=candidate division WS6 bacterium GW2011_GWE1_34_7 TaxID=1619093 RepID=A0A0G0BL32_9BACT|nr:MAG: hypothetical protein UR61_C0047G0003 [candidate division WS6 bacterium GW2011_GWE1_34_7]
MKTKKSILKSKTFWVNVLMAILVFLPELVNIGFTLDAKIVALIMLIVNIILRFITNTPVSLIKK